MNGFKSFYGGFESLRVNFKQKLRIEVESVLKKGIFVHVSNIFGLGLFLTKIKIMSKSF